MSQGIAILTAVTGLLLAPVYAQQRGGTTSPPAGGGTSTGRTTGSVPTTRQPGSETPQLSQPIYIAGRVMLEDGSLPTDEVVIERVCGGVRHSEGYADRKGYFNIQLGARNSNVMMDASEPGSPRDLLGIESSQNPGIGGLSAQSLANCEIQARLAGYRSQIVPLFNRRSLDDPNIGVILLHRLVEGEGGTVSGVSLAAPKDARKAFEKGMNALKKNKSEEAVESFQKAVDTYPKYATAWNELGKLQNKQGQTEAAQKSFQSAIQADPKFIGPYLELSFIAIQGQKWEELAQITDKSLKLDPFSYPREYLFNAVAHYNLKHLDQAEKSAREAGKLDSRHEFADSERLLGTILAQRQDYTGAAEHLRSYLSFRPNARDAQAARSQLEEIEKMHAAAAPAPPVSPE